MPKHPAKTAETRVLAALQDFTGPDEGGWHINEPALVPDLSLEQTTGALGRLRRKGLVECVRWHAGQGAPTEWLWFPRHRTPPGVPE